MFCPNCGKQNDDNAVFCFDCGARIQVQNVEPTPIINVTDTSDVTAPQNTGGNVNYPPAQPPVNEIDPNQYPAGNNGSVQVQQKQPMNKKTIIILAAVFGVFGLLIAVLVVILLIFTPEKAAENYINALADGDYKKAYSYIYDAEKKYVSEEQYVEYMTKNNSIHRGNINKIDCESAVQRGKYSALSMTSTDVVYNCYVNFGVEEAVYDEYLGEIIPSSVYVEVVKRGGFVYKVSMADEFVTDVTVRGLKGATVTIDGVQLTTQEGSHEYSHSETYATFNAPVLLSGNHTLKVEHEMYDPIEETIYVGEYDDSFYFTNMDLKEETRTQIFNQSTEIFKSMCAAAMSSKDFSAVSGNISTDADDYSDLSYDFNYFRNRIKNSDGVGYSSLNFTSFTDATSDFGIENNTYTCKVNYTYDNVYIYKDYRSATGYNQRETKGAEGYIYLSFEFIDGGWQLVSIRDYKI